MDITTVIVVLLIILGVGGGAAYLLRDFGRQVLAHDAAELRAGLEAGLEARQEAALGALRGELERQRNELQSFTGEQQTLLGRLRERGAELDGLISRSRELIGREEQARRDAERVPKPAPVVPGLNGAGERLRERHAEVLNDLYGHLARIETAIAALTTPILLPGEPYTVPDDFPPEALRWENWKEIGEAAYALGDYFAQHRPLLGDETSRAVAGCVTILRVALTRSIYPNLTPSPSAEQVVALRTGLSQIAAELPRVRAGLERDYRSLAALGPGA